PPQNPKIVDGKLRSVSAGINYDSRPLILNKGEEMQGFAEQYTLLSAGIQYASPKFLRSDFDFRRYSISVDRRQRIFGLGTSTLYFYWGASDRALPPQEYFTVDYSGDLFLNRKGFSTLGRNNFSGSQATVVTLRHDFGRRLFYRSGLPLVKSLPLDLSVFGGAFWTDFRNHPAMVGDNSVRVARRAYSEIGFRVANLTPFLSPFNFGVDFSWQLSAYNTNRSAITLRLGL
ncbi:MAG TPA: hypothetical protein VMS71_05660, partial [Candidatus Acidoferrum sp.]|nr:hypothetical protein [Candidatus Acidoferrum sp.]